MTTGLKNLQNGLSRRDRCRKTTISSFEYMIIDLQKVKKNLFRQSLLHHSAQSRNIKDSIQVSFYQNRLHLTS